MNLLEEARESINEIDAQIAKLYQQRMEAARQVALYKMEHNLPVLDAAREAQVIAQNTARMPLEFQDQYEAFLHFLMQQSRDFQLSLISRDVVAYAGEVGAFAHTASKKLFPFNRLHPKADFRSVIESVLSHEAQYGVIPLENTNAGLVGEVLDLLYQYPVYINNVYDLKIEQVLLGHPKASLKDVEEVYSKDVALEQVASFLRSLDVKKIPYSNTALAAKFVAEQDDVHKAAIGSRDNAELYGLQVLADHIDENPQNTTRFLVISSHPEKDEHEHLGLILSVKNEIGALASVIDTLSRHHLNLSSLQSRPIKERPFEYFFFIQCSGDLSKENIEATLRELEPHTLLLKSLGSYDLGGNT